MNPLAALLYLLDSSFNSKEMKTYRKLRREGKIEVSKDERQAEWLCLILCALVFIGIPVLGIIMC